MPVEHGIALVPPIPCVEGVVSEYQPDAIPYVLLLVVLDLHELVAEVVVVEELVVVVAQYQMLLPIQVLEQSHRGLRVVAGDVAQDEHMIVWLHYAVPVLLYSVVVVLRPIQLVVRECHLILCSPNGVRVGLVAKVDVRYVEVVCHHKVSLLCWYLQQWGEKPT